MINYNELFDVAYSNTLPESVKDSVIDKVLESIGEELNESLSQEDSHYVVFLNSLVESGMSEGTINDILDKTFENVSEEVINEVSDAWKKAKATEYVNRRKEQVNKMVKPQRSMLGTDTSPVGLSGFKRNVMNKEIKRGEDFIKKNVKSQAPSQPTQNKPSAMDKLKSAVGKVKSWVDKARGNDKPVGLSKLKQEKEERIKKAVEMGTGPKEAPKAEKEEQPKEETKQEEPKETPKEETKQEEQPKEEPKETPKEETKQEETPKEETKQEEQPKESTRRKRKSTVNKDIEAAQKEAEEVEQPKEETTEQPKTTATRRTTKKTKEKLDTEAENVVNTVRKKTKKTTKKSSKKKKTANEALEEFTSILKSSNVSEAIIGEITEMISNKKAAEKAVERDYKEFSKAADALNKVEETKAITGASPVSPEQHKKMLEKAAKKGARYERFKALADKKFG